MKPVNNNGAGHDCRTTVAILWLLMLCAGQVHAAEVAAPGQPLQIWFIRHGESEVNVPGLPHPVPDGGISYPLTTKGVQQVTALARTLADVPITALYTSTYPRAIQTADAIAFQHGLTLALTPQAIEIDLGVKRDAEDPRVVYGAMAHKWVIEKDVTARHGNGETFADAQHRLLPFVRDLMNHHAQDTGVIVVVAHGATLGLLLPIVAGNVPADFGLRYPMLNTSIINTELRDSRLFCTEWAGIGSAEFPKVGSSVDHGTEPGAELPGGELRGPANPAPP